jgi:hypothetical protein
VGVFKLKKWQVGLAVVGVMLGGSMLWVSGLRAAGSLVWPKEVEGVGNRTDKGEILGGSVGYLAGVVGDWVWWRMAPGGTEERVQRLLTLADKRLGTAERLIGEADKDEVGVKMLEKAEGYLSRAKEEGKQLQEMGVDEGIEEALGDSMETHEEKLEWAEGAVEDNLRPRVVKLRERCEVE